MILGSSAESGKAAQGQARTTLDEIFHRVAGRHPEALALADPPNRMRFTDGAPRRLTYREADRVISAVAGRLRRVGLPTDSVVGIQLPNTVESILALLGVMRAGMIAAPLPMLWRRSDCVAALSRVGAKALITCGHVGEADHGALAMQVAAEIFPIRYVCAFGAALPDGIIPFDDLFTIERPDPLPASAQERAGNPAAHVAAVTFDIGGDGVIPVARSHMELLAGGLAALLESGAAQDATILSSLPVSSFAGLAMTVLPWLLCGGTLVLHQPFDAETLAAQLSERRCDIAIVPGPVAARLADAGVLTTANGLKTVLACWRAPERIAANAQWRLADIGMVDVAVFGEIGLLAARRQAGRPLPVPVGPITAPRGVAGAVVVAKVARTDAGTLSMSGPMVPRHAFPPGSGRTIWPAAQKPARKDDDPDAVDTGYTCRLDTDPRNLVVTGPPAGLVAVGGYRFMLRDIQDHVVQTDASGSLAALPDPYAGHRLAGQAQNRAALQHSLAALGVNPLIVRAFRERKDGLQPG